MTDAPNTAEPPRAYTFFGVVHPERTAVTITPFTQMAEAPGRGAVTFDFTVDNSQVIVAVALDFVLDLPTLKNVVATQVARLVDAYGFLNGCGLDVEITAVRTATGEQHVFGVDIPRVAQRTPNVSFDDIIRRIYLSPYALPIQPALADLREAARNPDDSGFHCFRAVEALRHHWRQGTQDDAAEWAAMSHALRVDKSATDLLHRWADPQRHGALVEMSDSERADVLNVAWEIVDRYCRLALSDADAIDDETFNVRADTQRVRTHGRLRSGPRTVSVAS